MLKKLVTLGAGVLAAGAAVVISTGVAASQPGGSYNVVGEPYGKAMQILRAQGVKATFGGSFGSVLQQSNCLVDSQKLTSAGKMLLMLDCSQAAADRLKATQPAGGPRVGSNGITTVTPTPIVPIQGAPGAGTPPPVG